MINFEKHLKEVLYEYDFIVIPNFGAFIANFEVLENNGESHPSKTFSFNRLLNIDENQKFFNYLVRAENKPLSDIQIQWNNFLLNLKNELHKNKRLEVAGLGSVIILEDEEIGFKFLDNCNFYERDSFEKIDEFETPSISKKPSKSEALIIESKLEEEKKQQVVISQEFIPKTDNSSKLDEVYQNSKENYLAEEELPKEEYHEEVETNQWKFLIWLLPLLLFLALVYYFWNTKNEQSKASLSAIDSTNIAMDSTLLEIDELDSTNFDSTKAIVDIEPILEKVEAKNPVVDKPKKQNSPKIKYHVWAGLFQSKSNADKLRKKLRNGGLKAEIQMVKDMRRVYVPVSTESQAKTTVKKIEQLTGDKAVYFEVD